MGSVSVMMIWSGIGLNTTGYRVESYVKIESWSAKRTLVIIKVTICFVSNSPVYGTWVSGKQLEFLNVDPNGTDHEYGSEAKGGIC